MSTKKNVIYFCTECGNESVKWLGKCPWCNAWNSFREEIAPTKNSTNKLASTADFLDEITQEEVGVKDKKNTKARVLDEIEGAQEIRMLTRDEELNRVLGGGMVAGAITLVAGEPGIGKSTLFLQTALQLTSTRTLYISGEESARQIKSRADRITHTPNPNLHILTETATDTIFRELKTLQPELVIIDSIQTLHSPFVDAAAGSIVQIRECASEMQRYAKKTGTPVFLIGHINKDGAVAGPKILEHIVDCVVQFEGDRNHTFRILRTLKNRFGANTEIGVYDMKISGLMPILNPSEIFLSAHHNNYNGTAVAAVMEGVRPMLLEVQALVASAVYGTPQRTVKGFDPKKLQLLLAVLEKHGGFRLGDKDVFVNITGGLKIEDPSLDLAIICALLSSYEDKSLPAKTCFVGEVGLASEIRAVSRIEQRIMEVEKLGFSAIVIPTDNFHTLTLTPKIEILHASKVEQVYQMFFG